MCDAVKNRFRSEGKPHRLPTAQTPWEMQGLSKDSAADVIPLQPVLGQLTKHRV